MKSTYQLQYVSASCQFAFHQSQMEVVKQRLSLHTEKHTSHLGFLNEEHLPTAVRVCFLQIRLPPVTVGGGEAEAESTHRETYTTSHLKFLNEEYLPTAVRVCFLPIRLPPVTVGGGEAEAESTHRETYITSGIPK